MMLTLRTNLDGLSSAQLRIDALSSAHEAGHVVMRELLRLPYQKVTLADEEGPARVEVPSILEVDRTVLDHEVLAAFAGAIAETVVFQSAPAEEVAAGACIDLAFVRETLGERASDKVYIDQLLAQTLALVERNLPQIRNVAKALWNNHHLSPDEVRQAFAGMPLEAVL